MPVSLMEPHIKQHIEEIKKILLELPIDSNSLEIQVEYAAKHVKPYLQVIKTHIHQLKEVLKTENHNYKTLESITISEQVQQLMNLFTKLEEKDIQYFEEISAITKEWQKEKVVFEEDINIQNTKTA